MRCPSRPSRCSPNRSDGVIMQADPATALLTLWEVGADPLALLAASSGETPETIALMPVGRRDAALVDLHAALFGTAIAATISCPACEAVAEVALDAADILAQPAGEPEVEVSFEDWTVKARAANSRDIAALEQASGDADAAAIANRARRLALALVTDCRRAGQPQNPETLPDAVIDALGEALAAADPLATIDLAINCPACGGTIVALHDPAVHLARAVDSGARRVVSDVALLARSFGWSEAEILAMGPQRRAAYLELVT